MSTSRYNAANVLTNSAIGTLTHYEGEIIDQVELIRYLKPW
jgi:hypothetical protein